ncbi:hypothetical protein Zmor_007346 [Zophobas morio]|uniref:Trehalase n=1 Tax=Zophobas morio TaxID=2755281 RepID=A0AA38MNH3_9CUCU|nr:hypothetical protein Zmor_007346 [Zophobas morio]
MGPLLFLVFVAHALAQTQPSCDSKIYCQGDLLHTIQMAKPFEDSKTFVDMKLKHDEKTTLDNFDVFITNTNNNPTKEEVQQFVSDNFEEGNEFEDWVPSDYTPNPQILSKIADTEIRNFASKLVAIWPKLARKVKQEVFDTPELYTLLPVEHGFIVPGGRFKEFYYWDSYWIIKGLLVCEMYDTVKGMLDNFLSIVEKYGFLPNGARIYYLNRSQPPLLTLMAATYIQATNDTTWLLNNIKTLDKELRFWLDNKVVTVPKNGINYTLAHYDSESGSPRPESYYEDVDTARRLPNEEDRIQLYADLKSGAESGWDFSSRWIVDENGTANANLTSLQTRRIIPVDLNAFLCQAFRKLGELYVIIHDFENAVYWFEMASIWQKTIQDVLYNEEGGIWYDWDNVLSQHRKIFFA